MPTNPKKLFFDEQNRFVEMFNSKTGFYVRSNVLDNNMKETTEEPFKRSYPVLLDIGIMGNCINAEKGLCRHSGIDCYQSGLHKKKQHMTIQNYEKIMKEGKGRLFKCSLGGRGDPNKHPEFEAFLAVSKQYDVVPSYTTSGLELSDREIELTKQYCGSVACSWHKADYTKTALKRFIDAGCKTNIHFVLNRYTIYEAIELLEKDVIIDGLNAIIFLLYKNVGYGLENKLLQPDNEQLERFCELIGKERKYKIGFDSCSASLILQRNSKTINIDSIDYCEAARFSCFIDSEMIMTTCSFDVERKWGVDLNCSTVEEAWNSKQFEQFRNNMLSKCPSCNIRKSCYGGCTIVPKITLCSKKEKT